MAASLELAVTAIRSGRQEEGRQLLNLLIQQNPNDEMAWLWMSSVVNTDEQRARCLYHVLAINPENELAQRGLKILGIVVTDSRPVKIPRDSRPIPIPKPTTDSRPTFPSVAQVEQATPAEERRPFRIDPQAIVDELPFTPVRQPFEAAHQPGPTAAQADQPAHPSEPVPVVHARVESGLPSPPSLDTMPLPGQAAPQTSAPPPEPGPVAADGLPEVSAEQTRPPSEPVPAIGPNPGLVTPAEVRTETSQPQTPSEPVTPVIQSDAGAEQAAGQSPSPSEPVTPVTPVIQSGQQIAPTPANTTFETGPLPSNPANPSASGPGQPAYFETGQLRPPSEPVPVTHQPYYAQYPPAGQMSVQETRPTQPLPTPHTNQTQVMPQYTRSLGPGQQSAPVASHFNPTLGMPTQHLPAQNPSQPVSAVHSNPTMGINLPGQSQYGGQLPHPSEPVPAIHSNGTVPMPQPQYPQPQLPLMAAQGPSIYSNATMAMPLGYDPLAALSAPLRKDYRRAAPRRSYEPDEEEEDEVNILAVIVFGSLSVTALGGLGMLILLMFTAT